MKTHVVSILLHFSVLVGTAPAAEPPATTVPMQLCIGGGDHLDASDIPGKVNAEKELAKSLVKLGATSHETYVRWSMLEPEEGRFTFALQDALLAVDREAGLKWVPFLIAGPAYTLPQWYYQKPGSAGYVCLEHGTESDIQSLWNPKMRSHAVKVIGEFAKHYGKNDGLESVLLGITGNYGESIFPASLPDWTQDLHGPYHAHVGWWCGDPFAVEHFRTTAKGEYGKINALNDNWGTTFTSFAEVEPRLPQDWPTTAARQWQAEWIMEVMSDYADLWMREAKRGFPETDVYLVTGGHAPAYHGLDVSDQTRRAAAHGCGIRITNEVNEFAYNYALTRMVASACRLYGTFFSYEPAGPLNARGVAARVFNASSSGARTLHWYPDNLNGSDERLRKWEETRPFAAKRDPVLDAAVFYPRRWMNLQGDEELVHMYRDFAGLRNAFDYEFVDERMLEDLLRTDKQPFKTLVVREDFDDDALSSAALSRYLAQENAPEVIRYSRGEPQGEGAEPFLRELSRKVHPDDDFTSGVYFARFTDDSLLFLNDTPSEIDLAETHPRMVTTPTPVGPYGLAEVRNRKKK